MAAPFPFRLAIASVHQGHQFCVEQLFFISIAIPGERINVVFPFIARQKQEFCRLFRHGRVLTADSLLGGSKAPTNCWNSFVSTICKSASHNSICSDETRKMCLQLKKITFEYATPARTFKGYAAQ